MRRFWKSAVGLAVTALSLIAAKPHHPEIVLTLNRQAGSVPFAVRVQTAYVRDPDHELHCPDVTYDWGDGLTEYRAADCPDVYAMPEDEPTEYYFDKPEPHTYYTRGDLTFRMVVRGAGRSYVKELPVISR